MTNLIHFTLRGEDRYFNADNDIQDIVSDEAFDGPVSIITLKNGHQIFFDQSPKEIYEAIKGANKDKENLPDWVLEQFSEFRKAIVENIRKGTFNK